MTTIAKTSEDTKKEQLRELLRRANEELGDDGGAIARYRASKPFFVRYAEFRARKHQYAHLISRDSPFIAGK